MSFLKSSWCFGPLGKFQHNIKISIKTARVSRLFVSCDYEQIKQANDEELLLRIFGSLYFEIKYNNNKNDSFEFFYQERFLPLRYA